jgi:hypothetical protein
MTSQSLRDRIKAQLSRPGANVETPTKAPDKSTDFLYGHVPPVGMSSELERILSLPRRPAYSYPDENYITSLSNQLRRPGGSRNLRPIQAWCLKEIKEAAGLVGAIPVGEGKTDICALAGMMLDGDRIAYMVPAALKKKYSEIEYPYLSTQYKIPNLHNHSIQYTDTKKVMHLISYHQLSRPESKDILWQVKPQIVICDEAHSLKDPSSTRTKRFMRYFEEFPDTILIVLSGTLTTNSILDYAHLSKYALKNRSPVPRPSANGNSPTLAEWSSAIDPLPFNSPPGQLIQFCNVNESVREGFGRRLLETPGWVASKPGKDMPRASLTLFERELSIPPIVQTALRDLRKDWVTPGDEYLMYALEVHAKARQLAAGLFTRWIWPRGESAEIVTEWKTARAFWAKEVREKLKGLGKDGEDSVKLLTDAAVNGTWKSLHWKRWEAVKDLAKPETEAVWIDKYLAQDAVDWGKKNAGIIWYEHAELGHEIARLGSFPLYGPGSGEKLQNNEKGDRSVVCSIKANSEGWNLIQFNNNLITTPPSSSKTNEQLLGRTHRSTQKADEVEATYYLHTPEMRKALQDAVRSAEYAEQTKQGRQKLLYCTWGFKL